MRYVEGKRFDIGLPPKVSAGGMMKPDELTNRIIFTNNLEALGIRYPHIAFRLAKNNPLSILSLRSNPFIPKSSPEKSAPYRTGQPNPFSMPGKNIIFIGVHCYLQFKRLSDVASPESFRIVVYEPNIDVFQIALQEFDLSREFRHEQMTFVVGSNNYFAGIKALRSKLVYEKEVMYSVYGACRSFFNYAWPLEVHSEENCKDLFSCYSSSLRHLLQSAFLKLTRRNTMTSKRKFEEGCAALLKNLFSQLKLANEFILRSKNTEKLTAGKTKIILILRAPRLWNWRLRRGICSDRQ
jgi:hypothetical protein